MTEFGVAGGPTSGAPAMGASPLAGRVALVTGASRGIGAAIAVALAREGMRVVGPHRDARKAKRAARLRAAVEAEGGVLVCPLADLTHDGERRRVIDLVREHFGRLDLLVHNAAGGLEPGADEQSARAINVEAKLALNELALPLMPGGALILDITSVLAMRHGEIDVPPAYELVARTKKEGERELRRRLPELEARGVGLGFVCGHVVEGTSTTALLRRRLPEAVAQLADSATGGRPPRVEDMAAAVVRLARYGCPPGAVEYIGGADTGTIGLRAAGSPPRAAEPCDARPAAPAAGDRYSYESFAQQPFCREVDRALLAQAPCVHSAVDLATGTGAAVEHLLDLRKVEPTGRVLGVDLDHAALSFAAAKLRARGHVGIGFLEARAEQVPLPGGCAQLVSFCNAIHLTDPARTLAEAWRVLTPNGMLLLNTAYERGEAYPGNSARYWGLLVSLARRALQARHGYKEIAKPVELLTHTKAEFVALAQAAGFADVRIETYPTSLDREAMRAICMYEEFARGSLPGVPVELATQVLVTAVDAVFERYQLTSIPRNWVFLSARKP